MKLTQIEKNKLVDCLEVCISKRLRTLSMEVVSSPDKCYYDELDDIKEDIKLRDKLDKDGWGDWAE